MTTIDISQTGIESNLINQKMNKGPLQTQPEPNKEKDDPIVGTDSVKITANISEKAAIEFEPIDEEQANSIAQLVANDLSKQSYGMSGQDGIDILRSFV
jgi:hypothetical protein